MPSVDALLERQLVRLPFGSKLALMQNRFASFGEQGIQGAANVLVNIILARSLTREGFGTIGLMLALHFFVLGLHRTVVVLPFILSAPDGEEISAEIESRWWWLNLLSLGVVAATLIIATLIVMLVAPAPEYAWFRTSLALTIIITPPLLLYEFGRRMLYQRKLAVTAMAAAAVYFVLNIGGALVVTHMGATPERGAMAWVFAGLGAAAVATLGACPGRPEFRKGINLWLENRSFAFWQALTNLPYAVYNAPAGVVIGMFGGPTAVAAFTAARTLTNPAISMVTAVDSLDKPRGARGLAKDGLPGLRKSVGQTRRLLAIITGGYLGLIVLFAAPVLHFAFRDGYAGEVNEIRVLAVAFFLICMNQPSETWLIVLRASKLLLIIRTIAAVFAVAALALAASHGLMGICMAMLLTHTLNLGIHLLAQTLAERHWQREQDDLALGAHEMARPAMERVLP